MKSENYSLTYYKRNQLFAQKEIGRPNTLGEREMVNWIKIALIESKEESKPKLPQIQDSYMDNHRFSYYLCKPFF